VIEIHLGLYIIASRDLAALSLALQNAVNGGEGDVLLSKASYLRQRAVQGASDIERHMLDLRPSWLLMQRMKNAVKRIETESTLTLAEALAVLAELQKDVLVELMTPVFLAIPAEKREFFRQTKPAFGQEVYDTFSDARDDIADATRCIALDEPKAAVFHLMCVLEHGLRTLAKQLKINKGVEIKEWSTIIDDIEREIKAMRKLKRTPARDKKSQFYSEAASGFIHYRDAWRNHAIHSRGEYNEQRAMVIWENVRALMHHLATKSPR
jgi:hypothetical protein